MAKLARKLVSKRRQACARERPDLRLFGQAVEDANRQLSVPRHRAQLPRDIDAGKKSKKTPNQNSDNGSASFCCFPLLFFSTLAWEGIPARCLLKRLSD